MLQFPRIIHTRALRQSREPTIAHPAAETISTASLRRALSALRHTRAAERIDDSPLLGLTLISQRLGIDGLNDTPESRRWLLSVLVHEIVQARLDELRGTRAAEVGAGAPAQGDRLLTEDFAAGSREREAWSALHARYLSERELAMSEVTEIAGVGRTTLARRLNTGLELLAARIRELEREARRAEASERDATAAGSLAKPSEPPSIAADSPAPSAPIRNLPRRRTRFLGREAELAAVEALLDEARLVTLSGAGGSGKTRLAMELVSRRRTAYPDGVVWVDLASRAGQNAAQLAVAEALDLPSPSGRSLASTLSSELRAKRMLLVLDNCEHLVDEVARLADRLVEAGEGIRILATSQEALGIEGERAWRVPPLGLPSGEDAARGGLARLHESDAIALFVARASASKPGFELTEDNAAAILQICKGLDGLPLAIELAAARAKLMAPEQIAARLEERFQLLAGGGMRLATPRHQTLRASLDWSYALLEDGERLLLQRTSVFAGSWTVEDVEAVCTGPGVDAWLAIDTLSRLVDKSLIVVEDAGAQTRYRLLESIRRYAREQLAASGGEPAVLEAHARHFLGVAEAAEPELRGPRQAEVLQRLSLAQDDLVAAIERSAEQAEGQERALRIACALGQFWSKRSASMERGRALVVRLLDRDLGATPELQPLRAKAMLIAGNLTRAQGSPAVAMSYYERAYHLALEEEDDLAVAKALTGLGKASSSLTRYAEAKQHLTQSLALYQGLGDTLGIASSLNTLGVIAEQQGDTAAAVDMHERAAALAGELGDDLSRAISLGNLARALLARGEREAARARFLESAEISQRMGDRIGEAWVAQQLGGMAIEEGRLERARQRIEAALEIFRELGNAQRSAWCLQQLAQIALREGRLEDAASLADESLEIGTSLEIGRAVAGAKELLGRIHRAAGRRELARRYADASLSIYRELEEVPNIANLLGLLADMAKDEGDEARAARLLRERSELLGLDTPENDAATPENDMG